MKVVPQLAPTGELGCEMDLRPGSMRESGAPPGLRAQWGGKKKERKKKEKKKKVKVVIMV